jgi:type IV pilus assembly protein PilO
MTVMTKRPVVAQRVTKRMRGLLNLLNLHFAGVAVLGLVNLYLLVHMAFAWQAANSQNAAALADQTVAMKAAEIAKRPLEGLDEKLAQATKDADKFYKQRLPFAYSEVAGELGVLKNKQGVKLTRVQYAEAPIMDKTAGALTEVRMDASLSGDYRPLVLFINGLERDKMFFMIQSLTLTGQQSGTVGLRLKLTTYLRSPIGAESSDKNVVTSGADADGTAAPVGAADGGPSRR